MTGHLVAFLALVVLDWLYADYTRSVAQGSVWKSSVIAAALYGFGGVATLAVVGDPWRLPAAMAGAFAGTAMAQWRATMKS